MGRDFLLPDLGEGLTEAEVVNWLVAVGDTIAIDQPVIEVESAKSIVELPSPFGGVVEKLFGEVGEVIHAGSVLLTVADDSAAVAPAPATVPPVKAAAPEDPAGETGRPLVGYGPGESTRGVRRPAGGRFGRPAAPTEAPAPAAAAAAPATQAAAAPAAASPAAASAAPAVQGPAVALLDPARRSPVVSPLVRRLARENGFDASQLSGSGAQSLVLRGDVESYIRGRQASEQAVAEPAAAPTAAPTQTPARSADRPVATPALPAAVLEDIRIPITGLRKVVSQRLTTSRREIPEATIWMDVDATELFVARDRLLAATGERFSVTALIARFVVAGLRKYPLLNSSVDTASQEILQHAAINLGLAAQTSRGLMVPVVHGAQAMTTRQLRDAIAGIVAASADGTFPPSTLTGGTFTLNNFGSLGVDGSAAIINHPEAAILGIGRMIERPWVVNHELAVRTVVELSMVFDHRVCDGGTAAGFLTYIAGCIENPVAMLADL
ncbi:pyruvate dehydrogenase E2 component (dihydrolipoamide acetyltransferase) [Cryobacterium psychrotolerans]|uniref:Dihydrolipoamide acetyltransferase component of pyruvate dehydrogenase complex n=1 Tax=Cryobacterium psychrotolerans TaxID=386301 RepID=A0A1G9GC86_9MICO|nr:dihydrolipoamide acetyltransferase family protein [Cryobacterium psychrotolerans]TFD88187.1 2-oxo acid dehydrogenase subunit E2 [Cryobacterium psychrotolerans]SDK98185.1 pyruvate dehydrogenase E2 component (dihydrolipoamide acetyltransferase) [Cryobacterium psychrotolerans]